MKYLGNSAISHSAQWRNSLLITPLITTPHYPNSSFCLAASVSPSTFPDSCLLISFLSPSPLRFFPYPSYVLFSLPLSLSLIRALAQAGSPTLAATEDRSRSLSSFSFGNHTHAHIALCYKRKARLKAKSSGYGHLGVDSVAKGEVTDRTSQRKVENIP